MIARRCGGRGCRAVRTSVGTFSQNSFSSAATIGTPAKRYDAARTNIDQPAKQLTTINAATRGQPVAAVNLHAVQLSVTTAASAHPW